MLPARRERFGDRCGEEGWELCCSVYVGVLRFTISVGDDDNTSDYKG